MLYHGLCAVVDGALARLPEGSAAHLHREALLWGILREDVVVLPFGVVLEHLSLTHQTGVWPGGFVPLLVPSPHQVLRWRLQQARRQRARGNEVRAWVTVGRALHLVADLACPAHASRTVHLRDPFEGWVEMHGYELVGEPPLVPLPGELSELTHALARRARTHTPDGTTSPWGRLLCRLGQRAPVPFAQVALQAAELLPLAMATAASVILHFEAQEVSSRKMWSLSRGLEGSSGRVGGMSTR
jgi:hypothetical protein